jgi:hypothetical protein
MKSELVCSTALTLYAAFDATARSNTGRIASKALRSTGVIDRWVLVVGAPPLGSSQSASDPRLSMLSSPVGGRLTRVQCHRGADEPLQRLFINLVALVEIDGTPGVAFETGVEEA